MIARKIGASGVTLEVVRAPSAVPAVATGAPLVPGLPKTLGFGEAHFGNLGPGPTFDAQIDGFAEGNPGFGGKTVGALSRSQLFFVIAGEAGTTITVKESGSVHAP
jgi:hypothetical protein